MVDERPTAKNEQVKERSAAPKPGEGIVGQLPEIVGPSAGGRGSQTTATPIETKTVNRGRQSAFSPTGDAFKLNTDFPEFDDLGQTSAPTDEQDRSGATPGVKSRNRPPSYEEAQRGFEERAGRPADRTTTQPDDKTDESKLKPVDVQKRDVVDGDRTKPGINVTDEQKEILQKGVDLIGNKGPSWVRYSERQHALAEKPGRTADPSLDSKIADHIRESSPEISQIRSTMRAIARQNPGVTDKEAYTAAAKMVFDGLKKDGSDMRLLVQDRINPADGKRIGYNLNVLNTTNDTKATMGTLPLITNRQNPQAGPGQADGDKLTPARAIERLVARMEANELQEKLAKDNENLPPHPLEKTARDVVDVIKNGTRDGENLDPSAAKKLADAFRTSRNPEALAEQINLLGAAESISVEYDHGIHFSTSMKMEGRSRNLEGTGKLFSYKAEIPKGKPLEVDAKEIQSMAETVKDATAFDNDYTHLTNLQILEKGIKTDRDLQLRVNSLNERLATTSDPLGLVEQINRQLPGGQEVEKMGGRHGYATAQALAYLESQDRSQKLSYTNELRVNRYQGIKVLHKTIPLGK